MIKLIFTLITIAFLSGCDLSQNQAPVDKTISNQCIRAELFKQCMSMIPVGPSTLVDTKNNWSDVVSECGTQSYYQSLRAKSKIPVECRTE
jgi:hypothetical protein